MKPNIEEDMSLGFTKTKTNLEIQLLPSTIRIRFPPEAVQEINNNPNLILEIVISPEGMADLNRTTLN